jgi:hypothetical protein
MTRVDATFKPKRSMVANNKTEGKDENSSGLRVPMAIMMISKLQAMLNVNSTSKSNAGRGTTNMAMINKHQRGQAETGVIKFGKVLSNR